MILTEAIKGWLVKHANVAEDATDAEFKQAAADSLLEGKLDLKTVTELAKTPEEALSEEFNTKLANLGDILSDLKSALVDDTKAGDKKPFAAAADEEEETEAEDDEDEETMEKPKSTPGNQKMSSVSKLLSKMAGGFGLGDDDESPQIRVKRAVEQYEDTKSAMLFPKTTEKGRAHPMAGRPVLDYSDSTQAGRQIYAPSDRDKAVSGAFAKFLVHSARLKSRTLAFMQLPEHDRDLMAYALEKMAWGGASDGGDTADIKNRRLTPNEQKALIDDPTSGGIEAAPIVFDDQIIQTPLLNGELYPLVTTVPLDRGRRVEGVATGTVTASWGGVDDTAIDLFDTASYVSAFDTTIFRWEGAIRIGLDFLSDTPIDFNSHITSQYGERLLEDLDDVIATGNGTTQPEGVMVKSGTTSVSFGGSTTIGNYESLRFGVSKAEHKANLKASAVFCGSETSYQRAKAIPVGASDARRLSDTVGMPNYDDYAWMQRPYKINESLGNTKIFYAILAKYRMYRRRGLTMRTSQEGDTLMRRNEMLMIAMARYGGHLERGAVAAVTSTAPA